MGLLVSVQNMCPCKVLSECVYMSLKLICSRVFDMAVPEEEGGGGR